MYALPDLCLYGFNGSLQLCVTDKKNDTSNSYSVEVGETDDNQFCYCFKVENLKLLPGDYKVSISKQNVALFEGKTSNAHRTRTLRFLIYFFIMNDFLWVEKYRPEKVEDCILPKSVKSTFQSFIDQGEIPNLLLSGTAGVGKTTIAKALCNELGADYYVINGSDEGRFLDTVRNQAKNFASTVSLTASARHKVLIIDEADNTTPDVQLLLRASIEEFQRTVDSSLLVTSRTRSSSAT